MDLLNYKYTKGQSDFEITLAEKINDLEHYEMMYKDAFDTQCAKMEFDEELFNNCLHETEECNDFYFCIIEETDKSITLEKPVITDDMQEPEKESILALPEILYRKNIIHLLINKSGCFRFTSDNQKYLNNKEQQAAALEQYTKMIAVLFDVAKEKEGKAEKELAEEQIRELKQQLTGSDYKITRNAEAISVGLECPYPAKELYAQREEMRKEINKLELKLKKL